MKKAVIALVVLVLVAAGSAYGYQRFILLPELRSHVGKQFSDPDSLQFRNESYFGPWSKSGDYCGQVNAKNRVGGYVGYRYFQVIGGVEGTPTFWDEKPIPDVCDYEEWIDGETWWWLRW